MWVPFDIHIRRVNCCSRHQEKVAFPGQLGNVSWKNIVIIDMFVYMICRNFVCNATVQYYLFMSFL